MIFKLDSHSPDETFLIGEKIGGCLQGHEIILLCGDLGAGKTMLTKGIAASLGIDPDEVVSPTFTLLNQFECQRKSPSGGTGDTDIQLIHFDCYRLADTGGMGAGDNRYSGTGCAGLMSGLVLPEIDEWLNVALVVIEWAQYLHHSYFKLKNAVSIQMTVTAPGNRVIQVDSRLTYLRI